MPGKAALRAGKMGLSGLAEREGGEKFACIYPKPVAFAPKSPQQTEGVSVLQKVLFSGVVVKGNECVTDRRHRGFG